MPDLKPAHWAGAGDGTANDPPGWDITGDAPDAVDTQAIVDQELIQDEGYLDGYAWAWYPPETITGSLYQQSVILRPYLAHLASAHRRKVKVSLYLQHGWFYAQTTGGGTPGDGRAAYAAQIASEMRAASDDWLKVKGRPVVYLYDPDDWAADMATTNILKAALPPDTYYVGLGGTSPASGNLATIGASGTVQYGPNGISLVGAGQHPYSDVFAADSARWFASGGRDLTTGTTPAHDRRGRANDFDGNAISWAPAPTMPDRMRGIREAYRAGSVLHTEYAYDELSEGGHANIVGSSQMGTYIRDAGLYGRLMAAGQQARMPATYTYPVDWHSAYVTQSGWTWSRTGGSVIAGAFASDDVRASGGTATSSFSHECATRFRVFGSKASGWGSLSFTTDGGAATVVSLNNGGAEVPMQLLYDTGVLAEGTHTVAANDNGGGTVSVDYVEITWNPRCAA